MIERHITHKIEPDYPHRRASHAEPTVAVIESEAGSEHEFSLREFLNILRRRKAIAIQTFLMVVGIGLVITLMTKPLYRSAARILVEGKSASLTLNNTSDPLASVFLPPAGHEVETQVEMLRSPTLINKVVEETKIPLKSVHVDVRQVAKTDVIELSVTADSKNSAENFARTLPDRYLRDIKIERTREVATALNYANKRLKEKLARLTKAEAALAQFKAGAGVINPNEQASEEIRAAAAAQAAARQAEAEAAAAASRLAAVQASRTNLPTTITSPVTVTNNEQIEERKKEVAQLEDERNKLLQFYKEDDDKVTAVDAQIAVAKARLAQTPKTKTSVTQAPNPVVADYEKQLAEARAAYSAAQANMSATQASAGALSANLGRYNPIERQQAQLLREIESGKDSVVMLAKSVEELTLRKRAAEAANDPVKIIAAASRASQIAPRMVRNMVLATLLGLMLACGAALLQNTLDDHLSDEEEARQMLGTPVLGHSPRMSGGHSPLIGLPEGDPHLLERFRVLRSNVQFSLINRPSRSLLITSTNPGEGKTSTACNLAVAMAMDKRQIILVDADLRRPRVNEVFGMDLQPGLTNVLVGQTPLHEALREAYVPGLRVLTAGALPPNSAELLNSPAFDDLFRVLQDSCDVVIFDSPPTLATADAQVLASKVDGVLYVMELGKVQKSAVQRAFELLHQARARVIGVVFNKVDQNTSSYYGYESYGEYVYGGDSNGNHRNGSQPKSGRGSNGQNGQSENGHTLSPLKKAVWYQNDADNGAASETAEADVEVGRDR